ncbi:hypothetical protein, partial [Acinetobacter baumannii]|uniref:hypothetical protein n=1 Tax=Acinetobacter baumannii TaxID=470 RepID=UPI00339659D6
QAISTSNTRAVDKLMLTKTETFPKSIVPYIARLLVARVSVVQHLTEFLQSLHTCNYFWLHHINFA